MVQKKGINKLPYRIRYDIMVITLAKPGNIHSDSCYTLSENTPENFPTIISWLVKKNSHDLIVPKDFRKKRCSGLKSMSPTSKRGKRGQETSLPVLAPTLLPTPLQVVFISFICWVLYAVSLLISNIAGVQNQQSSGTMVGTHTVATHLSPSPSESNKEMM